MCIDKLHDIINKHNNTYHSKIKIKPVGVTLETYIDCIKEINDDHPNFQIGDNVKISKYQNVFAKGYTPNLPEEVFLIKKVKNAVLRY